MSNFPQLNKDMPAKNAGIFFVFDIKYRKNTQKKREKYKINFHILKACNFKCRQCFFKIWNGKAGSKPILYPGLVQYMRNKEVMSDFIDKIDADQWKILRMKPFQYGNFSNLDVQVSDKKFEVFVERNSEKNREKDKKENRKGKNME